MMIITKLQSFNNYDEIGFRITASKVDIKCDGDRIWSDTMIFGYDDFLMIFCPSYIRNPMFSSRKSVSLS